MDSSGNKNSHSYSKNNENVVYVHGETEAKFFPAKEPLIETEGREEPSEVGLTKNKSRVLTTLARMKRVKKSNIEKIRID